MASAYDIFGGICITLVSVQILKSVLPWIYQNFLGPMTFGSPVKLKEMGQWACEYRFSSFLMVKNVD
jgi:hypothetical protein